MFVVTAAFRCATPCPHVADTWVGLVRTALLRFETVQDYIGEQLHSGDVRLRFVIYKIRVTGEQILTRSAVQCVRLCPGNRRAV